jgi:hypothetical protein
MFPLCAYSVKDKLLFKQCFSSPALTVQLVILSLSEQVLCEYCESPQNLVNIFFFLSQFHTYKQKRNTFLWSPKYHWCAHKSAPLLSIGSQLSPVVTDQASSHSPFYPLIYVQVLPVPLTLLHCPSLCPWLDILTTLGFRRSWNDFFRLLGCYTA